MIMSVAHERMLGDDLCDFKCVNTTDHAGTSSIRFGRAEGKDRLGRMEGPCT